MLNAWRNLDVNGRLITAIFGDYQLAEWGKDKLLSDPDTSQQSALALTRNPRAFERNFPIPTLARWSTRSASQCLRIPAGEYRFTRKTIHQGWP